MKVGFVDVGCENHTDVVLELQPENSREISIVRTLIKQGYGVAHAQFDEFVHVRLQPQTPTAHKEVS